MKRSPASFSNCSFFCDNCQEGYKTIFGFNTCCPVLTVIRTGCTVAKLLVMASCLDFIFDYRSMKNKKDTDTKLTEREAEVLALMAKGLSHKEAGTKLFISPKTIRTHLQNIYAKLRVRNKIEAINKVK